MDTNLTRLAKSFVFGTILGAANPIPGVSAGTIALLFNVYDKFFTSVSLAAAKKNAPAVATFFIGNALGLFAASSVLLFLFENHGAFISFIFMGLIIGCMPMVYIKSTAGGRPAAGNAAVCAAAFALMVFLAVYGSDLTANYTIEQLGGVTPGLIAWVFFGSIVSSAAILIPGVGGSLIMIVLGTYAIYIEAIATLNVVLLGVFIGSMILGVLLGIAVIKKLLERFARTLYSAIFGFTAGSLIVIFPGFSADAEGILAVLLAAAAGAFAFWLSKKEKN